MCVCVRSHACMVFDVWFQFQDKTPYSIMFGPDRCGTSSKIHFIVQFKNPVSGEIEEKHSKQAPDALNFFEDKRTHLFTLCECCQPDGGGYPRPSTCLAPLWDR